MSATSAPDAGDLLRRIDSAVKERAKRLPDEPAAIAAMVDAYSRLKELGWNDAIYCPKDGTWFDVIEVGSTGIHRCQYIGEWPDGSWWISDGGDLYPSYPTLWRQTSTSSEQEPSHD